MYPNNVARQILNKLWAMYWRVLVPYFWMTFPQFRTSLLEGTKLLQYRLDETADNTEARVVSHSIVLSIYLLKSDLVDSSYQTI
jgi:hypothetical protein